MKTTSTIIAISCCLILLSLIGCSRAQEAAKAVALANDARDGKVTVTTEQGEKMTVDATQAGQNGGTVTVTGPEGATQSQWGGDAVKAEDIGIEFYPGATVEHSGTTTATGENAGQFSMVALTTADPFDAVAKFYKDKYATGNTVVEQPNNLMITLNEGENAGKMIMVMSDPSSSKTQVMISTKR